MGGPDSDSIREVTAGYEAVVAAWSIQSKGSPRLLLLLRFSSYSSWIQTEPAYSSYAENKNGLSTARVRNSVQLTEVPAFAFGTVLVWALLPLLHFSAAPMRTANCLIENISRLYDQGDFGKF